MKTRIAKDSDELKALEIYQRLLRHSKILTEKVLSQRLADVLYFWDKYIPEGFPGGQKLQGEGDLGSRLESAFQEVFSKRAKRNNCLKAIVIGTDCPFLTSDLIREAFNSLDDNDWCLGPANDGGYTLLGIKSPNTNLFRDIHWSTDQVLKETIQRGLESGLKLPYLLPKLSDIDTWEDVLNHFREAIEHE